MRPTQRKDDPRKVTRYAGHTLASRSHKKWLVRTDTTGPCGRGSSRSARNLPGGPLHPLRAAVEHRRVRASQPGDASPIIGKQQFTHTVLSKSPTFSVIRSARRSFRLERCSG